jgi:phosphopantothenoylcysteine decarboxylase/phosphopantothenate--cysteine ligase
MATLTIRNLSQSAHDALRRRAAANRRSMEAEARLLIEGLEAAEPPAVDQRVLRGMQERTVAAFGGPEAAKDALDEFLANRSKDWGEE